MALACDLHHPEASGATPLLLLHGFFGAASDWTPLLPGFGAAQRIVVPDLPGHGRSRRPSSGRFTHREAAGDVLALLDELAIPRVRAVGLSGGGNVLLHLATRAPERVEAMAIVSATTHFPEPARAIQRHFTLETFDAAELERVHARHPGGVAQVDWLVQQARGFADSYDDLCFTAAELGGIRARTLIVYGDRDPLYPVEIAVAMYRGIPGSALWVVPGGGHVPILGQPFVATARTFLQLQQP